MQYTLNHTTTQPQGAAAPKSRRPRLIGPHLTRRITRLVKKDPAVTYQGIKEQLGLTVSNVTIRKVLQEQGISNWRKKRRPALTEAHARARLKWAREHQDWSVEKWAKVIWSDECSVERGKGKQTEWVFRASTQKWDKPMIQPIKKGKDYSIMIWAAFSGVMGRSQLVVIDRDGDSKRGGYSSASYLSVLEEVMETIYDPDLQFMQDNAPIHTALAVTDWLKEKGVNVMAFPPYSPDLNPIEHIWFPLKEKVYELRPDIEEIHGEEAVKGILGSTLEEAWEKIDWARFEALIDSYRRRIDAVIKAEGWWTKY
jgi:hypothetical protein